MIYQNNELVKLSDLIIPKLQPIFNNKDYTQNDVKYSLNNAENSKKSSFSMPKEIENLVFNEDFYKNFQYEDKTQITESIEELQEQIQEIDNEYEHDLPDEIWDKRFELRQKLKALENGYETAYDYVVGKAKDRIYEEYKYNPEKYNKLVEENNKKIQNCYNYHYLNFDCSRAYMCKKRN